MKKIELIGASGVGKTTFSKELLKSKRAWKTPDEARIEIVRNMTFKNFKSHKQKLCYLLLKLNIFPNINSKFASHSLSNYVKEKMYNDMNKYNDLISLMLNSIINDNEIESFRKGEFIAFYMNLIINDIIAIEDSNENSLILYDDGIVHNTIGLLNEEYFNLMITKNHKILDYVLPQAVIFCELNIEDNIKRRKQRIANGKGTCFETNLSHDKIVQICQKSISNSNNKISLLKKYNIPILKINMNDPVKINVKIVNEFISEINNSY